MGTIQINDQTIYYEIHGKGAPLVLVAGFKCDCTIWQPIIHELKKHFEILIFDNRCVGRSSTSKKSFSIDDMALDTIELIGKLKISRPHILGHSMGGAIVQILARDKRDLLGKIIISNSFIKINHVTKQAIEFENKLRKENIPLSLIKELMIPWVYSDLYLSDKKNLEELMEQTKRDLYPQSYQGYFLQKEAILAFDSSEWFRSIEGPILVIGGDEDILCPRDSEKISSYLSEAKFVDFHRVGHCSFHEKPKEFISIVSNFLK